MNDQQEEQWKLPLALTIGFHVLVALMTIFSPSFLSRPELPQVYTVSLFNAAELPQPTAPPVKVPAAAKQPVSEKTAAPKPSAAPEKVVSLRPVKRKIKKAEPKKEKKNDDLLAKALKKIENRATEKMMQRQADQQVASALDTLRQSLHSSSVDYSSQAPAAGPSGGTSDLPESLKRYYADLMLHIRQFWELPNLQDWDENLKAIVVIKIRRDGYVIKSFFEKKSDNAYFNKFVSQTIEQASPMPPFPDDIPKNQMEIGLNFTPGDLF